MAGELTSTPSLGFGIALQGQPNNYANIYLSRENARQKAEAAKAKAKRDDDKEFNRLLMSVNIKGAVHPLYEGEAKERLATTIQKLNQNRINNPNNYMNTSVQDIQNMYLDQAQAVDRSKKLYDIQKAIETNKALEPSTPAQQQFYDALRSGDEVTLSKITDPYGTVGWDPKSRTAMYNPVPAVDIEAMQLKDVANDNLKTERYTEFDKGYSDLKGGRKAIIYRTIPENTRGELANSRLGDINTYRRYVTNKMSSGELPMDFLSTPASDDKAKKVRELWSNDLRVKGGVKEKEEIQVGWAPARASTANKDEFDYTGSDTETSLYAVSGAGKVGETGSLSKGEVRGEVPSVWNVSPPSQEVGLRLTTSALDGESFKPISSPINVKVRLGQIHLLPTMKGIKGVVKKADREKLIKAGRGDELIYKPFVIADATEEIITETAQGEQMKKTISSVFVPFEEVRSRYGEKKYKGLVERVDAKAAELNQKRGAVAPTTEVSKTEKETTTSGNSMGGNGGKGKWSKYKR
jgi:hypothetical protein